MATIQKPYLLVREAFDRIGKALFGDAWAGVEAYRERRWDDRTTTSSNRWRSSPEEAKRLLAQPKNPIFASNKPLWPAPDSKEYQEEYEAWCRHVSVVNKLNEIMADYDVESRFRDARYGGPDHAIDSANWDSRNHLFWFNLSTNLGGYGGSADGEIRIDRPGFDAAFGKLFFPEGEQTAKPAATNDTQGEGGRKPTSKDVAIREMIVLVEKKIERSLTKNTAIEFFRKGPHDIHDNFKNAHLVEDKDVQFIVWLDANGSQSTTAPGSLGAYRTALKKEARH